MSNTIPAERVSNRYPDKPFPDRDIATVNDNDGVRFLFDLAFGYCYPGGPLLGRPAPADPEHGAVITNMTRQGSGDGSGSVAIATSLGSEISYAGGGFDLSLAQAGGVAGPTGLLGPAAALADIWTAAPAGAANPGNSQHFLWVGYFKLPAVADWPATDGIAPLFSAADGIAGYSGFADILTVNLDVGSPYLIEARRQVSIGSLEATIALQPAAGDYGNLVQLAYWRNEMGSVFRLRSGAGTVQSPATVYAANTADFSAERPCWGHPNNFRGDAVGYAGLRLYRGWLENLARSGRNPSAVLDADWDDVVRRGQFS